MLCCTETAVTIFTILTTSSSNNSPTLKKAVEGLPLQNQNRKWHCFAQSLSSDMSEAEYE